MNNWQAKKMRPRYPLSIVCGIAVYCPVQSAVDVGTRIERFEGERQVI